MQDLNDLYYFAGVVTHGGFGPASRALRLPKSKLSRRIAQLEERLGIRLLERSTRQFRVTDVGKAFYERCRIVLIEAEAAEAVIAETQGDPHGLVRFSCPPGMLQAISTVLPPFLDRYPGIRLSIMSTNVAIELISQRIDVAMRVRTTLDSDPTLTMRKLASTERFLVASPAVAATIPLDAGVDTLVDRATLSFFGQDGEDRWTMTNRAGEERLIPLSPRMICSEIPTLRHAAIKGAGIAFLPDHSCRRELASGSLVRVFPAWSSEPSLIHLVFTSRRGLPPAVRAFIDHLAAAFQHDVLLRDLDLPDTGRIPG